MPEDLRQQAFAQARRLGISFGEFVRDALKSALASAPRSGPKTDSLLCDRATFRGGIPTDYSIRHDDYLYGDPLRVAENGPTLRGRRFPGRRKGS
ncbi:MAG: hypothetical protein HY922_12095 [Elusimicrobia bacterium]|nr:hypothetical protein [Elusimicrobiota bacterium]